MLHALVVGALRSFAAKSRAPPLLRIVIAPSFQLQSQNDPQVFERSRRDLQKNLQIQIIIIIIIIIATLVYTLRPLRFKRLDLRFLEIGVLRVIFTKRDPEFPGISGQVV
eukprot:sb/3477280/